MEAPSFSFSRPYVYMDYIITYSSVSYLLRRHASIDSRHRIIKCSVRSALRIAGSSKSPRRSKGCIGTWASEVRGRQGGGKGGMDCARNVARVVMCYRCRHCPCPLFLGGSGFTHLSHTARSCFPPWSWFTAP